MFNLFRDLDFVALVEVVGVELLVAEVAAGFTVVLLVDGDDVGVLVALADGLASVLAVDGVHTALDDVALAVVVGLTSAADAATRAGHHLDEVVAVGVAFADFFHEFASVAETVADGNLDGQTSEVDSGFADALAKDTAALLEVDLREGLAGVDLVGGTEGSLHNTAGGAEDDGGTSGLAEGAVEVFLGHAVEVDVALLEHVGELTGGEAEVDILVGTVAEFGTGALALLGQAGHNGDAYDILALHANLRGEVVLGDSAEHTLGRLGGRGMTEQVGEVLLVEGDPSGAAAGEHGHLDVLIASEEFLHAAEKLGAFFHDGEVSAPVGVEDIVETEAAEGSGHLAGDDGAGFHAELFAEGDADGGSGLDDDLLGRVGEGLTHVVDVVDEGEGTHGADLDALAAVDAGAVAEFLLEGGSHHRGEAAVDAAEGADALELGAHGLAAAAVDALVHVAVDAEGGVFLIVALLAFEGDLADAHLGGEGLEFAVAALLALEAVVRVVAKDQLEDGLAGVEGAGRSGEDLHTFDTVGGAGGGQVAAGLAVEVLGDLNHADAASAGFVFKFHSVELEVAERRNLDTGHAGSFQDSGAFGDLDRFVIYSDINHF